MAAKPVDQKKKPRRVRRLSLRDRLSRLTYRAAVKLLGPDGEALLRQGGRCDLAAAECADWIGDSLQVQVPSYGGPTDSVVVVRQTAGRQQELEVTCSICSGTCEHQAAALSMILDEKLSLGLSDVPDPGTPMELLTEEELIRRAIAERQQRADEESMLVRAMEDGGPWVDYLITSRQSGKSYRVAFRGFEPGQSYCSCPDYRTNHLGTCKHILHVARKIRRKFSASVLARPYRRRNVSLRVDYGPVLGLRFEIPTKLASGAEKLLEKWRDRTTDSVHDVLDVVRRLERQGTSVHIYPDAEEFVQQRLSSERLRREAAEIRRDPDQHPLLTSLLRVPLLPYQLDGIAFAVGAGRAMLADEMGLGKTIQGVGTAELLARLAGIQRVLVITPASLKSQWRAEIQRFSGRSCQLVSGSAEERADQYAQPAFFTICNYEQVLRDLTPIERSAWDLIILDEGQRIKNWEGKTSRVIKSLRSQFALVLSGTPLENRLEELYSVVSFIDDRRLGPAYRFLHQHRTVDDGGRICGYKNLDVLRETLKPLILRRTRASVALQLPERSTEMVRVRPTAEQLEMSDQHTKAAARIAAKSYLTEMDMLRIQKHLLAARMAADSTFLVDKQPPGFSSKLERLAELLEQLGSEHDRKIIIFSEWTTMLNLVEPLLKNLQMSFVRLDGDVPQKQRPAIIDEFQTSTECRAILMSNAGTTGLNLQAANTVINLDLPWNPAVLEQRIGRAHRMGQKRPVQVYLMITEDTLEERLLDTLAAKHDLALAALDVESSASEVELRGGIEELKRRMERLLGQQPDAPIDASQLDSYENDGKSTVSGASNDQRVRVAAAGGELLGAALQLVGELVQHSGPAQPEQVRQIRQGLDSCLERDETGRHQLRLTFPDEQSVQRLAETLAKLLVPQ